MIDWINIALLFLRLASKLVDWGSEQRAIKVGEDREIARSTAEILRKTQVGREIMDRIYKLGDSALDDELRKLEDE